MKFCYCVANYKAICHTWADFVNKIESIGTAFGKIELCFDFFQRLRKVIF